MKRLLALIILAPLTFASLSTIVRGQEEARASWQVASFDIAAAVQQSERALTAVATLTINNVGRAAGTGVTLRINSKAKVNSVKVNGATAAFLTLADTRGNVQRLNITLSPPVAANSSASVAIDYRLPVDGNTGLEAISSNGSQFLPLASWYPMLNTPFTIRGADTVPFKLRIEGANVISSGIEKAQSGAVVYEQPLNGEPFFLQGEWDRSEGAGESKGIVAFLPKGAPSEERKQAEAMISAAAAARSFYAAQLGAAPDVPIRLVAVRRGAGFNDAGTALIELGAFRRSKLDAATAMLVAETVAHLWIGAKTPIRGEAVGVLREGLTRYLATLFIEKQFGREAAETELLRQRAAYAAVAKRDTPLSRSSPLDDTYYGAVPNKSAMVWRLVERRLGRNEFMATLRSALASPGGLSLAALRTRLAEQGGAAFKTMLDQELDQPTDMNLMIGLPQQRAGEWVAALRNFGSFDAVVSITATTDRGEQIRAEATVPAQNFGEAVFKTAAKVVRVEIDPDKLYPQLDYTDDVIPRSRDLGEATVEARRLLNAQDYAGTERVTREILAANSRVQEARVLLARALLGENRTDEAEKLFRAALEDVLPTAATLAWANIGLGEIALKKGQAADASRRFTEAVRAAESDYAASLAARAQRIKAESAAANSAPPVDEAARAFFTQLDHTITAGTKAELDTKVMPGELIRFVGGITGTKPEVWQTRVLRTEQLEEGLLAADVFITSKVLGKDQSGTALFILVRSGGVWKLSGIELFEIR